MILSIEFGTTGLGRPLNPEWWYQPRIAHERYPIDLLPNFGLDAPDPQAGVGTVKSAPSPYWAIRGTTAVRSKRPYSTSCSVKPPPDWDGKDFSDKATRARDVAWLVQAEAGAYVDIGNTCRGFASADNGKLITAKIDVPGMAISDIDKIYLAAARRLSEVTVD
ncbi:hypothetical protein [Caenimonas koreensis]|uniref:Uncharacterized protein n=1 Tax=Caenimonas koreensis DSM 17982 TaxID=1121255 RepID=A0A844AXV5_9BURK|nr:hypothetical protein [Caenimonas koreensis]MRD47238.1 hypothetical protein [Caenimonas koreensis DSM 17982]